MNRIPSGIPDKYFDHSKYFKVVDIDRPRKDEDVNETIQRDGVHLFPVVKMSESVWGGNVSGNIHEVNWYKNKGKK